MKFKAIDYIVGEIIEAETKEALLKNLNNRFESYKRKTCPYPPRMVFVKGIYYLYSK